MVLEWLGGSLGCPGVVGSPSRMSESGREPSRMSGRCQDALTNFWEWSGGPPDVREWSGGPPRCLGVVGRFSTSAMTAWSTSRIGP